MAAPEFPRKSTSRCRHRLAGSVLQRTEQTQVFDTLPLLNYTSRFQMRLDSSNYCESLVSSKIMLEQRRCGALRQNRRAGNSSRTASASSFSRRSSKMLAEGAKTFWLPADCMPTCLLPLKLSQLNPSVQHVTERWSRFVGNASMVPAAFVAGMHFPHKSDNGYLVRQWNVSISS